MLNTLCQGRIQDLKKEGAQRLRRLAPRIFLVNLGLFKEIDAKRGGRAPPAPPPLWIRACMYYAFQVLHMSGRYKVD